MFDVRKLLPAVQAPSGFTLWSYDGGEDLPSEIAHSGYFRSPHLRANDRIAIVCADGDVHMDAAVKSVDPVEIGELARHPDGAAFQRQRKAAKAKAAGAADVAN
jgi:hypothetical protein